MANALELKEERKQLISELIADQGPDWEAQYRPGSVGCHELLDRTSLFMESLDRFVLSHPACVQNEEWFGLAHDAVSALNGLYQRIGEAHLSSE